MTDQSRVEAVSRGIDPDLWANLDRLEREGVSGFVHDEALYRADIGRAREQSLHRADRAIEANDAWLIRQKEPLKSAVSGMRAASEARGRLSKLIPIPEEPNR